MLENYFEKILHNRTRIISNYVTSIIVPNFQHTFDQRMVLVGCLLGFSILCMRNYSWSQTVKLSQSNCNMAFGIRMYNPFSESYLKSRFSFFFYLVYQNFKQLNFSCSHAMLIPSEFQNYYGFAEIKGFLSFCKQNRNMDESKTGFSLHTHVRRSPSITGDCNTKRKKSWKSETRSRC